MVRPLGLTSWQSEREKKVEGLAIPRDIRERDGGSANRFFGQVFSGLARWQSERERKVEGLTIQKDAVSVNRFFSQGISALSRCQGDREKEKKRWRTGNPKRRRLCQPLIWSGLWA